MADLAPFATASDLAVRMGVTFTPEEEAQVELFLDDASHELRAITGQPINRLTSTVTVWPDGPGRVYLPAVPVISVASVQQDGVDVDYRLRYDELLVPRTCRDEPLTVTFTHGWDPIPGELIKYTCVMAAAAYSGNQMTGSLGPVTGVARRQETIDDYTVIMDGQVSDDANASSMSLPERIAARLRSVYGARKGISWIEVR